MAESGTCTRKIKDTLFNVSMQQLGLSPCQALYHIMGPASSLRLLDSEMDIES